MRFGHSWMILQNAEKPEDLRYKNRTTEVTKENDKTDQIFSGRCPV